MTSSANERETRESSKERKEKAKSPSPSPARGARRYFDDEKANDFFIELAKSKNIESLADKDPMGYNPRLVPESWTNEMREWFSHVKYYCYRKALDRFSIPTIKEWIIYGNDVGFCWRDDTPFSKMNFIRSLRVFNDHNNTVALSKEKEAEAGMKIAAKKAKEAAMKTPSQIADEQRHKKAAAKHWTNTDWEQCFEECANCIEENGKRRCACGNATPANRRARPIPARECAQFAARAEGAQLEIRN